MIFEDAIKNYCLAAGITDWKPEAALIDMDGVLYDSMPLHASAWKRMMAEQGVSTSLEEFFLYEGMTGAATINLLFKKHLGREATPEEVDRLYSIKSKYFREAGQRKPMPGASQMLQVLMQHGIKRVLVTGSAQESLLRSLEQDYPGAFSSQGRVTAKDVVHGKPDAEPYLKGAQKANVATNKAIVIENAPLGVEAGHAAGCFTIAVATGPIPTSVLKEAGADIVFNSMPELASALPRILSYRME